MVWVYDSPLKKKERELQRELDKSLKKQSEKIVKLLSLLDYLHRQKFRSAKKLRESAFYDAKKTRPIFSEEQAEVLVGNMKMKGGKPPHNVVVDANKSSYPLTEYIIDTASSTAAKIDPTPISPTISTAFSFVKAPLEFVENTPFGPVAEIGIGLVHTASEIGVTMLNSIGPAIGGPVGMAVVLPISMFIALTSSSLAVAEGDLGQAVVHILNALPIVGQPLVKVITKSESMSRRTQRMRKKVGRIPVMGPIIEPLIPRIGGKTRRRHRN
jgi:hypothetical protein